MPATDSFDTTTVDGTRTSARARQKAPAAPHRPVPAPPRTRPTPAPRVSGREREVQQLIYDLALLAARQCPQ
ncbi:hypothetical protein [Pseudarthrobacter sp. C4D7]|uniref:hypothetical protein n=1 Tax=Pseudarthrobacter sp. C4D7 TaxID=2735268 RepID=UPI001584FBD8|nr:hypothetical protein [Pseudarthrobacter sp. C4D7]NUT72370.1 hypothetical protein [Pseudarthrobacter sp. C4D7]